LANSEAEADVTPASVAMTVYRYRFFDIVFILHWLGGGFLRK
jgi:hypothetical protein